MGFWRMVHFVINHFIIKKYHRWGRHIIIMQILMIHSFTNILLKQVYCLVVRIEDNETWLARSGARLIDGGELEMKENWNFVLERRAGKEGD